jgi:hypothetical protein
VLPKDALDVMKFATSPERSKQEQLLIGLGLGLPETFLFFKKMDLIPLERANHYF